MCAKWGCDKEATYDKPLCYEHWQEWEAWRLEECSRCHWFYENSEFIICDSTGDIEKEYPLMCDNCLATTLIENGRDNPWPGRELEKQPVASHKDIERPHRHVYTLKLSDATFYIGQTSNLAVRMQEHRDGQQKQTKGKDPKLVFFATYEGMRDEVNDVEKELIHLNQTKAGRRRLRELIEEFRTYGRLVDFEV